MTRNEQLKFCTTCLHREMDKSLGIICGITKLPADFEEDCPDYSRDEKAYSYQLKRELINAGDGLLSDLVEVPYNEIDAKKNKRAGVILMLLGIGLMIVLAMLDVLMIAGLSGISLLAVGWYLSDKGGQQEKILQRRLEELEEETDSNE